MLKGVKKTIQKTIGFVDIDINNHRVIATREGEQTLQITVSDAPPCRINTRFYVATPLFYTVGKGIGEEVFDRHTSLEGLLDELRHFAYEIHVIENDDQEAAILSHLAKEVAK